MTATEVDKKFINDREETLISDWKETENVNCSEDGVIILVGSFSSMYISGKGK